MEPTTGTWGVLLGNKLFIVQQDGQPTPTPRHVPVTYFHTHSQTPTAHLFTVKSCQTTGGSFLNCAATLMYKSSEGRVYMCVCECVFLVVTKVQRGYFPLTQVTKYQGYLLLDCSFVQHFCLSQISFRIIKFIWFYLILTYLLISISLCMSEDKACNNVTSISAVTFAFISALAQADGKFIFGSTFYLITVPSRLLVLPLPVCFRGNPSFVSQGSSANWENLKLSSQVKQLEHIWLWESLLNVLVNTPD